MRKIAVSAVVIVASLAAATYYYFSGKEYILRLAEPDIKKKLESKLPLTKTYLFIIQVTLQNPRVHLVDGSGRVGAGLDVMFNILVNKSAMPLGGTVDASGGIDYISESGEFYLIDPVIENLQVQGIPDVYTEKANKALTIALSEFYRQHPIYALHRTDIKEAAARMVLKDVRVEDGELVIVLGI